MVVINIRMFPSSFKVGRITLAFIVLDLIVAVSIINSFAVILVFYIYLAIFIIYGCRISTNCHDI